MGPGSDIRKHFNKSENMDFSWTEEQLKFKKAVIEFAQKELGSELIENDKHSRFPRGDWQKCAQFGILGLAIPNEYGGSGADILTSMLAMEALGYGCRDNGLIFAMNAQMWSVQHPILGFGSQSQKQKYLPGLCSGKLIAAHAMSEPDSGSDAYSLHTRATRTDEGYILNGVKMFVTNAPIADVALIFATVDPAKGMGGVSAFLVDKGTPGFSVSQSIEKMGLRTAQMGKFTLEDCIIAQWSGNAVVSWAAILERWNANWKMPSVIHVSVGSLARPLASFNPWPIALLT
jgi:alkylation response protein AidB-like acyl-CoA dehydrogenase